MLTLGVNDAIEMYSFQALMLASTLTLGVNGLLRHISIKFQNLFPKDVLSLYIRQAIDVA